MPANERLDDVKELVLKMAVITGHIDQRNQQSLQRIEGGVHSLDEAARRLHVGADEFANAVMQAVGSQVQAVVAARSAAALDAFNEQLRTSTAHVERASEAMAEQRRLLGTAQRTLVRQGLIALSLGSVLAMAAGGYFVWQARLAGDPALAADVHHALRSGALVRCNDHDLCARASVPPRGGKPARNEYVIVR